ncbi:unnamed protein product [Mucor hiemalis]
MLPVSNDPKKEKLKDVLLGLHWAATTGNVGLIKFALDRGVLIDSAVNGFVPLQLACISDNNIAAVQYLIDRGGDVNTQKWSKKHSVDKNRAVRGATGCTALHVACVNGCVKIVDLLLRNNARVDVKDKYGSTPLDLAQAKHETDIIHLLKNANKKQRKELHKYKQRNMSYNDELLHETNNRKSIDGFIKTHKRSASDKPRLRRPSLPSINEGAHQALPSFINMTPSTSSNNSEQASRRSFSAVHRPSMEEILSNYSCPATPRSSLDQHLLNGRRSHASSLSVPNSISPRTSEDSSLVVASSPPTSVYAANNVTEFPIAVTSDGRPDWYGYGVVNHYDDENYLLSLERRAFNLESNGIDRHEATRRPNDHTTYSYRRHMNEQDSKKLEIRVIDSSSQLPASNLSKDILEKRKSEISLSATESTSDAEEDDEIEDDEQVYQDKPLPRPSIVIDDGPEADIIRFKFEEFEPRAHSTDLPEMKRNKMKEEGRFSLDSIQRKSPDFRPSFNHLTIETANKSRYEDESSHKKTGFFSRWAPAWSKR